ncbi:MAG TPA: hypothetical protein VHB25_17375 [Gemmatimonadaceae bacterium]|nr:hypothetical protein [Gemmatimonadaceae bacterium]
MPNIRAPRVLATALLAAAAVSSMACSGMDRARRAIADRPYEQTDSMGAPAADVVTIPPHWPADLVENSAAVMSRAQPGIWFTLNDSGNDPLIFAVDTTGADRGVWRIANASNVDWESMALGPCGAGNAGRCLYVGDTGDNDARHPNRTIYRVPEPRAGAPGARGTLRAEILTYRYADGPHDVEAMYVAGDGATYLITKRVLKNANGAPREALVFALPAADWAHSPAVAAIVDSLPIVPGSAPMRLVTDAALSPNGRLLAVRTYAQAYVFAVDSASGRVQHQVPPAVCNLIGMDEAQGEGVTWVDDRRLLFTSEGNTAPAHIARCPLPASR